MGSAGQEINVVLCGTCSSVCSMSVWMHGENERRERERERKRERERELKTSLHRLTSYINYGGLILNL